jgi:transposase
MHRFIDGEERMQQALLPHSLEDYVGEENPVRVIEVFIDELDLAASGFSGMTPAATGRPAYHPSTPSPALSCACRISRVDCRERTSG